LHISLLFETGGSSRDLWKSLGRALGTVDGQIIVFFVMTVAAAEAD